MELILASASPRRNEILKSCGFEFKIIPAQIEEKLPKDSSPKEAVEALAYQKAKFIADAYPNEVVLGADTIVVLDGEILGKPKDEQDAAAMLRKLSGKTHEVRTGVAIIKGCKESIFSDLTFVTFYDLTDEQTERYVKTGEPMDKAGAYGIQGLGSVLVRSILGDYFNVMGLPIALTARMLTHFGQFGDTIIK